MNNYKQIQFVVGALIVGAFIYAPLAFAESDGQGQENERDQVKISVTENGRENNEQDLPERADVQSPRATGTATSSLGEARDQHDEEKPAKVEKDKQEQEDAQGDENDAFDGEEYSHSVGSSTVQLLKASEHESNDVKDEIKKLVEEQNKSKEAIAEKIDEVKSRSAALSFLVGADTEKTGQLREEMVKTGAHIDRLNTLIEKTIDPETKTALEHQVNVLSREQQKIGDLLLAKEGKFSLFGWFVKLFGN